MVDRRSRRLCSDPLIDPLLPTRPRSNHAPAHRRRYAAACMETTECMLRRRATSRRKQRRGLTSRWSLTAAHNQRSLAQRTLIRPDRLTLHRCHSCDARWTCGLHLPDLPPPHNHSLHSARRRSPSPLHSSRLPPPLHTRPPPSVMSLGSASAGGVASKKTPSDFLKSVLGRPVIVKLNSGVSYRGVLACLDGQSDEAHRCTRARGQSDARSGCGEIHKDGKQKRVKSPPSLTVVCRIMFCLIL